MPDLRRLRDDLAAFADLIGCPLTDWQAGALTLERRTTALVAPRQTGKSRSPAVAVVWWWAFRRRRLGAEPLPTLTPHGLRRTYASLLYALGESPVMHALGHTSPNLALGLHARVMERRDGEAEKLAALVGERAAMGNNGAPEFNRAPPRVADSSGESA